MFRRYLSVTKPGIIMGNLISVAGGFLLASRGDIDPWLMIATLIGLSLVVASGCAINNVIDRDIDVALNKFKLLDVDKNSTNVDKHHNHDHSRSLKKKDPRKSKKIKSKP